MDLGEILRSGRAMRQLSFAIDYKLFGLNPAGYHVESALLHSINCILFYQVMTLLLFGAPAALAASLIFAVHPVNVEAVAGIANRKELLALFFILLSFACYLRAVATAGLLKKSLLLSITLLFYILAFNSKQTAFLFPVVLIAYDYSFLDREKRLAGKAAVPLLFFVFLFIIYYIFRFIPDFVKLMADAKYWNLFLTDLSVIFWDLRYLLFPIQLSADHTIYKVHRLYNPFLLASLLIIISYCVAVHASFSRDRRFFVMLLWIPVFLLPAMNLIPKSSYFFAERYLYIPSMGFAACIGLLLGRLFRPSFDRRVISWAMVIIIILLFSSLTIMRNEIWFNEASLWEDTVKKSPRSFAAHNNLGNIYYLKGNLTGAVVEYEKALNIYPEHPESLYNLANIYFEAGDKVRASSYYNSFLKVWKGDKNKEVEVREKLRSLSSTGD